MNINYTIPFSQDIIDIIRDDHICPLCNTNLELANPEYSNAPMYLFHVKCPIQFSFSFMKDINVKKISFKVKNYICVQDFNRKETMIYYVDSDGVVIIDDLVKFDYQPESLLTKIKMLLTFI